ncbi:hypothetical protein LRP88_13023 [Fusarium phalaenopsidis]
MRQERTKRRERQRQEKIKKLEAERLRSRPEEQFQDEVEEEEQVIKRWIDQGIWRNEFRFSGPSKWKHEDPTSVEPKCGNEGDGIAFSLPREETKSAETEELKGTEVDQRQEREREASHPPLSISTSHPRTPQKMQKKHSKHITKSWGQR